MYKTSFCGVIKEKSNCRNCEINMYSLVIKLDSCSSIVSMTNLQYQPYYSYETDSSLNISVSKQIFELSKIGDTLRKDSNSNYILIREKTFSFLNDNKKLWLPN